MNCWKTLFISLASTLAVAISASALTPSGITEDSRITYNDATDSFTFSWQGRVGWTYFIQQSTDLMEWSYVPIIEPGAGEEIAWGFSVDLPNFGDAIFMRLMMSDVPTANAWQDDFDGDGFGNQLELDLGTDPLDVTDTDLDGIPDDVEAVWDNDVSTAWKQTIVDDANWAYYDPGNTIATEADLLPNGDYDGDAISNLEEWFDGTDAADFFNGKDAYAHVSAGDSVTAPQAAYLEPYLTVTLHDAYDRALIGAPVIYTASGNYLRGDKEDGGTLYASYRSVTGKFGAKAAFFTPSSTGTTTVTASFPNGLILEMDIYVVGAASYAKQPLRDFERTDNPNGTRTYTWTSDADLGDWFRIQDNQSDSTWEIIYETTYGSAELPYVSGQNSYSLTLDENDNYVSN